MGEVHTDLEHLVALAMDGLEELTPLAEWFDQDGEPIKGGR